MKSGFGSFDEYWCAFVLEHWRPSSRKLRLAESSLVALRAAIARLVPRAGWPAAATLLAWVKTLSGTMDREVERASRAAAWPPAHASGVLEGRAPLPERAAPGDRARDWAVWL